VDSGNIDDDGIHEITLLAAFKQGFTVSRIRIDEDSVTVFSADRKILTISKKDLSKLTITELGEKLVESSSKGKK
jgi:hypothetical protein